MTKTELIETYTAEQLAEMVIGLKTELSEKDKEKVIFENCDNIEVTLICEKCGDMFQIELSEKQNRFLKGKMIDKIHELESKVEKYRKAFEDAKRERDCQIAKYQKKIDELTSENEKLKGNMGSKGYYDKQNKTNNFYGMYACSAMNLTKDDVIMFLGVLTKELIENGIDFRYEMGSEPKVWDIKIKNDKVISDFLPTEPIKVADMLINASKKRKNCMTAKEYDKYIFEKWQLKQIAEHLLVYCNHNGEAEE